jgi:hypothetical protein
MGQLIHGKQQYQIAPDKRISVPAGSVLTVEFLFTCKLLEGEYTVEFGVVDVNRPRPSTETAFNAGVPDPSYEILYQARPIGKFAVVLKHLDAIRTNGHFGMVDVDATTRSCVVQMEAAGSPIH